MRHRRVVGTRPARASIMERLEARQLLANFVTTIEDTDGDVFQVSAENFTSAPLGNIFITNADSRVLTINGSTAASDIRITRTVNDGDGVLRLHAVNINGSIDELTMDNFVQVRNVGAGSASQVSISGRARVVTMDGELFSNLSIGENSLANRTTLTINVANGENFVLRGGTISGLTISSAGIFERVTIGSAQFVNLNARRFGIINIEDTFNPFDRGGPTGLTGTGLVFSVNATDFLAPYGIKTANIRCPIFDGNINSNSPVQTIICDGVIEPFAPRGPFPTSDFSVSVLGRLDTFKATDGSQYGTLQATSFGTIQALLDLSGTIEGPLQPSRGINGPTNSIDSLRAGQLLNNNVRVANGITSAILGEIDNSSIDAGWIGTLLINGGNHENGEFRSGSLVTLRATTAQRSRALDTLTVSGEFMANARLEVLANNVGSATFNGGISGDARFLVGVVNEANLFSGNPFASNFTITKLVVKQPLGETGINWSSGVIAAPTITTIQTTALPDSTNQSGGGNPYGLVFANTTTISVRSPLNNYFTDASGSLSSGDFRVRNI